MVMAADDKHLRATAEQPKAAGSSLIMRLTNFLALDYLHLAGIKLAKRCMPVLSASSAASISVAAPCQRRACHV